MCDFESIGRKLIKVDSLGFIGLYTYFDTEIKDKMIEKFGIEAFNSFDSKTFMIEFNKIKDEKIR